MDFVKFMNNLYHVNGPSQTLSLSVQVWPSHAHNDRLAQRVRGHTTRGPSQGPARPPGYHHTGQGRAPVLFNRRW